LPNIFVGYVASESAQTGSLYNLNLAHQGDQLSLNGEAVAPETLGVKVSDRLAHDRQKVVFFKISDDANYGRAVRLMDICKGAGAKTLGIVTKDDR